MAAPVVLGQTGLIEQPGSPHETQTDAGRVITRTFVFAGTGTPSHPAMGSVYDGLILKEISDQRDTKNGKRTVVYTYGEAYAELVNIPYSKIGETESEFDSNMISIPIEQHPSWQESWQESKPGVADYLSPQPVRRDTEYMTSLDTNISGVGKRGQNGYSTDWLYTGMTCRKIGIARAPGGALVDVYQRTRTYQFAANGWDGEIYAWI